MVQHFLLHICTYFFPPQIFPKFLERHSLRVPSRSTEASLRHHVTHACKLTFDLVSAWPPLIVSKPPKFREDWHDREYQYWEKLSPTSTSPSSSPTKSPSTPQEPKLLYTRPILFESYTGKVGAKGWVGNRDKELIGINGNARASISSGKNTHSRSKHRTRSDTSRGAAT